MTDLLEIFALGGLTLKRNGAPVSGLVSRKAEALLVYLACTGQPQAREVLADLLWDDRSQTQALANLRVLLTSLRQVLGPYVTITRQEVTFNQDSPYWLDVATLERGAAAGQAGLSQKGMLAADELAALARSLAVYQGDFLQGFYLRDCQGFEEWQLAERERLRLRVIQVQYDLINGYLALGDYPAGISWARRLLQLDSLQEEAHRLLMRLLALSGQRPAALAQYEICRQVLAEELGVEPGEDTVALVERIRTGELSPGPRQGRAQEPGPARAPNGQAAPPALPYHNLPVAANSFVNRVEELAQILAHLDNPLCRLLTLVGPGGIGKSRLAVEACRKIVANLAKSPGEAPDDKPSFADGVYFIALDALSSAEFLASTLANALHFSFYSGTEPISQLIDFLREKEMLLVLDNAEHLREGIDLLAAILKQAPQVKILAVSRERLNLQEEQLLSVRGLGWLAADADQEADAAVQLFLQRARAVDPDFAPQVEEQAEIARICSRVAGIPLAIELAAAWVRLLSCREIAGEIDRSIDFLATSLRNVPERHRSLRAVFDSSWQLLSAEEQRLFRRLAVFRGGFRREAAEQVAGASLSHLLALVDKSLLYRTETGRYLRHTLLWQYGAEKLQEASQEKAEVEARHCDYYTSFLQQREALLKVGARQQEVLGEISNEIGNIRASWYWAVEQGQTTALAQAMDSLFHFYDMRSWFQEGAEVFGRAVAGLEDGENSLLLGKLLARQGWFVFQMGQPEQAKAWLRQSLALLRSEVRSAPKEIVFALNYLGAVHQHLGEVELARRHLLESLSICEQVDDPFSLSITLNILSQVAYGQGDYAQAQHLCRESLALKRKIGDRRGMAFSFRNLGLVAYASAEYREAHSFFQEGLTINREIGDRRGIALSLNHLGDVARAMDRHQEARQFYQDSLAIFREIGNQWGLISTQTRLGQLACRLSEYETAGAHFGQALKMAMEIQAVPAALDVLAGLVTLLLETGGQAGATRAVELLSLVLHHPVASRETHDQAGRLLAELEGRLPAETIAAATSRATAGTLEAVVRELLREGNG